MSARAAERLNALRECTDGFEIARRDLDLRGPGEILGVRQAGAVQYRYADLGRDGALLPVVEQISSALLNEYPDAADVLIGRWLGTTTDYALA